VDLCLDKTSNCRCAVDPGHRGQQGGKRRREGGGERNFEILQTPILIPLFLHMWQMARI
jgi:hypothetical protein